MLGFRLYILGPFANNLHYFPFIHNSPIVQTIYKWLHKINFFKIYKKNKHHLYMSLFLMFVFL